MADEVEKRMSEEHIRGIIAYLDTIEDKEPTIVTVEIGDDQITQAVYQGVTFKFADNTSLECILRGLHQWKEWYTPDKPIDEELRSRLDECLGLQYEGPQEESKQSRRIRPNDAVKLQPFEKNLPLWNQHYLTKMVLDVATSPAESWKPFEKRNGFTLETDSGMAILENVGPFDNLKKILDMLGPEGLQYTLATLAHIEEIIRRKYSTPPDSRDQLTPVKIIVTDLLRTMGRKPSGSTFSREQQLRPQQFLKAQSMVDYADIKPTNGKLKMTIGPIINILDSELETCLPFDDIPDTGEVVSITVLPGKAVYGLMRKGIRWCHPQLLKYHPINQKFEIAMGFYIQQLAANKRGKQDQDFVKIRALERGSGVESFDSNPRRRMQKELRALNRLAKDGLMPGEYNEVIKEYQAIFTQSKNNSQLDAVESIRETMVKVIDQEALPNGYVPLVCTTKEP